MNEPQQAAEKAKAYQKIKQKLSLFHLAYTPLILFLSVITPLSLGFKDAAVSVSSHPWILVAVYFLFFNLYVLVLDLPFSWYSGFKLEHRFGLSNQTLSSWSKDFLKRIGLSFALSLLLFEALYALIRNFPDRWWIFAWAGYAVVSYVLGKLFPVFIVPLFYKYGKVEDESLKNRIFALAERYQMPVENVFSLNLSRTTKKANAAFMGLGKTKRVVLSDTLISHFSGDEIETVVAHELGHFKHKDIWKQLAFGLAASFLSFWIAFQVMDPLVRRFGINGVSDIAGLPVLFLVLYAVSILLMPIQNGFSRVVERAADRFSLEAYPKPDVFISCMEKLAQLNLADPEPNPVYEWIFYDHPAIGKRIQMARSWQKSG